MLKLHDPLCSVHRILVDGIVTFHVMYTKILLASYLSVMRCTTISYFTMQLISMEYDLLVKVNIMKTLFPVHIICLFDMWLITLFITTFTPLQLDAIKVITRRSLFITS